MQDPSGADGPAEEVMAVATGRFCTDLTADMRLIKIAVYEDWSLEQSLAFLKEQGIKVRDSQSLEEVRKQVAANADAAATVCHFRIYLECPSHAELNFSGVPVPPVRLRLTLRPVAPRPWRREL